MSIPAFAKQEVSLKPSFSRCTPLAKITLGYLESTQTDWELHFLETWKRKSRYLRGEVVPLCYLGTVVVLAQFPAWSHLGSFQVRCPTLTQTRPNHHSPIQHRGPLSAAQHNTVTFSRQLPGAATTSHSNLTRSLRRLPRPHSPNMLSSLQNPRQAAAQLMNFGLILSTAFMVCSYSCL